MLTRDAFWTLGQPAAAGQKLSSDARKPTALLGSHRAHADHFDNAGPLSLRVKEKGLGMGKALPVEVRSCVIAAVEEGMSRRQAAERFGLSVACVTRWHAVYRRTGNAHPKRRGGDRRSGRIEAYAPLILALFEAKSGITLAELQVLLAEQGVSVGIGTIWRFLDRRGIRCQGNLRRRSGMTNPTP